MGILRTPQVDNVGRQEPEGPHGVASPPPQTTGSGSHWGGIGIGAGVLLVLLLSAIAVQAAIDTAPVQTPTVVLEASQVPAVAAGVPGPSPTATATCISGQPYLALVTSLVERGDWSGAARAAEASVDVPGLCAEDRRKLTEQAATTGVKALSQAPFPNRWDAALEQELVDRYHALRARAHGAGVGLDTPLQVAQAAYTHSHFLLAKTTIEEALEQGAFKPALHRDVTQLYISTLYGLCFWMTAVPQDAELYEQGLAYCGASQQLAVGFCTGQGEAATRLDELLGTGTRPRPSRTPLDSYTGDSCS